MKRRGHPERSEGSALRWTERRTRIASPAIYAVHVQATGKLLCPRVLAATGFFARTRGLLGHEPLTLEAGEGLWLNPSQGVHTFGMRFPIDVLALDRHHRIVSVSARVPPWRIAGLHLRTRSVLELPAGSASLADAAQGDFLDFESHPST